MKPISPLDSRVRRVALPYWLRRFAASLSSAGMLVATLFFAASLTPSLLPRTFVMQGFLSGFSLAAGYKLGVFGRWLWSYLELPVPRAPAHRIITLVAGLLCGSTVLVFLWQAAEWQSSIRTRMGLEPVDSAHPFRVGAIAVALFTVLLAAARLFQSTARFASGKLRRVVPRRVAGAAGVVCAILLFWSILNGVLLRLVLRAMDTSFQQVDARIEAELEPPGDPSKTGSKASKVAWEDLGRRGREFVSSGPSREELSAFFGGGALEPIRVYVGLNCAESPAARARLALEELLRVGAFERSVLIILTPTGTGWIDPGAIDTVEYLHRGDVASVAVQYSYLPSWLSLLAEPEYGAETARAVFAEVYGHWRELPRGERPRLYLHGLSLGALNSERAADIYDVIGDPFSGALWSGPPFRSATWRAMTAQRRPGSPAWLPRFRDGSIVRFTNQQNALDLPGARWGPMRIVYLQYASDPITFFEWEALYRSPEWMSLPRGPDVSQELRWFPVVTMLQLVVDMAAADSAPRGYGHVYAPQHYIDAWAAVTEPPRWSDEDLQRLKELFRARRPMSAVR
jgi:uncharacterized membrane protein